MDLSIANYSGQPLVILTSDSLFDKRYIRDNMPNVNSLLSRAANQGWLSSLEGSIYADSIDRIVIAIRQSLSPQLLFQDFILAGDVAFMRNIFVPPKYIYCIGISTQNHKLVLTFNVFSTEVAISKYTKAEDLLTTLRIYLGYRGDSNTFYCDSLTPDGEPVCQKALPASARFINDAYETKHNPQLTILETQASNSGAPFEENMISKADIKSRVIMRNAPIASPIPPAGLDGQTFTTYMFLANNDESSFAASSDEVKQSFTIASKPNGWASIAVLLLVLLIIAIIVGVGMYLLKRNGDINVYGSSQIAQEATPVYI